MEIFNQNGEYDLYTKINNSQKLSIYSKPNIPKVYDSNVLLSSLRDDVAKLNTLNKVVLKDLNLKNFDFSNIEMLDNVKFINCDLIGANLSNKKLSNVTFDSCDLQFANVDNCLIEDSNFINSNLESSQFNNSKILQSNFKQNSSLRRVEISKSFLDKCQFTNVNLYGSELVELEMKNSLFNNVKFNSSTIKGKKTDNTSTLIENNEFKNVDFKKTHFSKLRFCNNKILNSNFSRAILSFVEFNNSKIEKCKFDEALLSSVDFNSLKETNMLDMIYQKLSNSSGTIDFGNNKVDYNNVSIPVYKFIEKFEPKLATRLLFGDRVSDTKQIYEELSRVTPQNGILEIVSPNNDNKLPQDNHNHKISLSRDSDNSLVVHVEDFEKQDFNSGKNSKIPAYTAMYQADFVIDKQSHLSKISDTSWAIKHTKKTFNSIDEEHMYSQEKLTQKMENAWLKRRFLSLYLWGMFNNNLNTFIYTKSSGEKSVYNPLTSDKFIPVDSKVKINPQNFQKKKAEILCDDTNYIRDDFEQNFRGNKNLVQEVFL